MPPYLRHATWLGILALFASGMIGQTAPSITSGPTSQAVAAGGTATLTANVSGTAPVSCQWQHNGVAIANATTTSLTLESIQPGDAGFYTLVATNAGGTATSTPALIGITATAEVTGSALLVDSDIVHPNGNHFDQVLLQGVAAAIKADVSNSRVTRISYVDLNDDIVQVEFSGPGTLSLILDGATGPAAPLNYSQPSVAYMKGHAGIVISGATQNTNVSVFTVGRATAFDPTGGYNIVFPASTTNDPARNASPLFAGKESVSFDGIADIAYLAIFSTDGKFGGVRTANANYWSARGVTGVYAPGVHVVGPVNVGNIDARDSATPMFMIDGADGGTRITGGDLKQENGQAVQASGIGQLLFTAGATSHNLSLPAQANRGRLVQNGADVTTQVAVSTADPFELIDSFLALDATIATRGPDVALAVGRADFLIIRNNVLALWQKPSRGTAAHMLATQELTTFFASILKSGDLLSDPDVLFDTDADRYFFVNAAFNECPDCGAHLLAVSKSAAPKTLTADDWYFYRFDRSLERLGTGPVKTTLEGDYDRMSIVGNRLFISWEAIDHDKGVGYDSLVRVLDKGELKAGVALDTWLDVHTNYDARPRMATITDAGDRSAAVPRAFLDLRQSPNGEWIIGAVEGLDTGALALASAVISTDSNYAQDTISPQPGTARPIFSDLHLSVQPIYRAGRLWVFEPRGISTSDPRAAVVWRELDVSNWPSIRVLQSGVFSEPGVSIVAPAATLDSAGNLVILYTRVGVNDFPSICYTGRLATDPKNTLRSGRLLRAGTRSFDIMPENGVVQRNSFIDFGTVATDPVDGSLWLASLVPTPDAPSGGRNEQSDAWIGLVRPLNATP